MTPELVSPAGGREAAWAALHYGADAIYIGLPRFSARAEAENVTLEDLDEIVGYAHGLTPRRRVLVTVNTLVQDHELRDVVRLVSGLDECRVDAVIVQDLGVLRLVREQFPRLRVHASTQMAVHNLEGARALKALGCARVVLARELSLEEIRDITRHAGLETEVFVHGALCYSYSGLCLFSSHAAGRSGNRGRCAYCCREVFEPAQGGASLPFSMKDLALGELLPDLAGAGVAAFKIEGRMKSPLYVAAVTDYYRRRLDGTLAGRDARAVEEDLRTIFSRPWTTLYLKPDAGESVIDPANVGHRGAVVGRVTGVRTDRDGSAWLRFRTSRPLEKHDGLQVDLPSTPQPFGFPIDALRPAGGDVRLRIEAPAGADVEVGLPPGAPPIPNGATVYCASSQAVKRRYPYERPRPGTCRQRRPVDVAVNVSRQELRATVTATDTPEVNATIVKDGPFDVARNPGKTRDAWRQAFERTGDTGWALAGLDVRDPDQVFVPLPVMNTVRRELMEALTAQYARVREARLSQLTLAGEARPETPPEAAETWSIKLRDPAILDALGTPDWEAVGEVVLQVADPFPAESARTLRRILERKAGRVEVRIGLPTVIRPSESPGLSELIEALRDEGFLRWEVSGLGGLGILNAAMADVDPGELDVTADWPMYLMNRLSIRQAMDLGIRQSVLSPEDDRANLLALAGLYGVGVILPVFQYTPVFLSETEPVLREGRKGTGGEVLISRAGNRYHVLRDGARTVVTDARAFCLSEHLGELRRAGARAFRVDLAYARETAADTAAAWRKVRAGEPLTGTHDGNYTRGLA